MHINIMGSWNCMASCIPDLFVNVCIYAYKYIPVCRRCSPWRPIFFLTSLLHMATESSINTLPSTCMGPHLSTLRQHLFLGMLALFQALPSPEVGTSFVSRQYIISIGPYLHYTTLHYTTLHYTTLCLFVAHIHIACGFSFGIIRF